ncbi:MAG TPA: hypothetical protein VN258_16045 [Mobilitalea sp.]|nr:hypothetical protein [Mobilitalea sp.]
MKRRFELIIAVILVLVLIAAGLISNAIVKGILLLIFAAALIFNTVLKIKGKTENRFKDKFFYGILLFLEVVLALGAVFVIVSAILEA